MNSPKSALRRVFRNRQPQKRPLLFLLDTMVEVEEELDIDTGIIMEIVNVHIGMEVMEVMVVFMVVVEELEVME